MSKSIWTPKSETTVVVQNGRVTITESMVMVLQPIKKPSGFQ